MRFWLLVVALIGAVVTAHGSDIRVESAWARATAPGASMGVVYLEVHNTGERADRLLSVTCEVAKLAELHESIADASGTMRMQAHAQGVAIPAKSITRFAPNGLHIMLIGLKKPLTNKSEFPVTLLFKHAGSVQTTATVMASAPDKAAGAHAAHGH